MKSVAALVFFYPGLTLLTLVWFFCVCALADGIITFVIAFRPNGRKHLRVVFFLLGIVNLAAGLFVFLDPLSTYLLLILFIGPWALITGALDIIAGIFLRVAVGETTWLLFGGAVSVVLGVLLLAQPDLAAPPFDWLTGAYGLAFGLFLIIFALKLRRFGQSLQTEDLDLL